MKHRLGAALLMAVALSPAVDAGQQQPVFRSSVNLVTVDVTVLGRDGRLLETLTREQFEITVDGRPRAVVSAEFVVFRNTPLATATAADHFSTNEDTQAGRLVLVAVDQTHIRRIEGRAALRAAANFIDALDPADRVAVAPLNHGGAITFTAQHATAKAQLQGLAGAAGAMPVHFKIGLSEALAIADGSRTRLDQVVIRECGVKLGQSESLARIAEEGGMKDPCPTQVEQEGRALAQQARTEARLSLDALQRLIFRLGQIEGPKTLVLLSEGLIAEPQLVDLTSLGAAAQAARVTIHVLQLETPILDASTDTISPTLYPDMQLRADGLARLAGSARGGLFRLVGDDPYPFRRILHELSGHYLIAFAADDGDRDGRIHRISVNVKAPGVTVRARPSFTYTGPATAVATDTALVRLLRDPRLATEVPMRIAAYTFRDTDPSKLHVLLSAEVDGGPRQEATAGFVLIDSRGIIAASGAGQTHDGRYFQSASVPPGRYTLRAAAVTGGARQGSVERQLDATLTASAGITLSDFMLAEPPVSPSEPLRPLIVSASADRLVAYIEAYGPETWRAQDARAVYEITGEGGPAILTVPASFKPVTPGRWVASADLPLATLKPGTYSAALRLTLPGSAEQTLSRRFVVK
jgi:VWFA-related protein